MTVLQMFEQTNRRGLKIKDFQKSTIDELLKAGWKINPSRCCMTEPNYKGIQSCEYCDNRWLLVDLSKEENKNE